METFGERLKDLIQTSVYKTNKRLSERIGYSEQTISNVCNGHSKPGLDFLAMLCMAFPNADMRWVISGEPDETMQRLNEVSLKLEKYQNLESAVKPSSNRVSPQESSSVCYPKMEYAS